MRAGRFSEFLFAAVLFAFALTWGHLAPGTYQDDDLDHYYLAREAWSQPSLFLDRWGMPLLTILIAGPARLFGYAGVEFMSALFTALGALAAARAGRALGLARPWTALAWVALQPLALELGYSGLAEPLGALLLAVALWAWYGGRPGRAVTIAGLLPLARIEAGVILALFLAAGWRRISWRGRLGALAPVVLWNLAGFALSGEPLFILGVGSEKPLASLGVGHYLRNAIVAWGPVVAFFLAWAIAARLQPARARTARFPALALLLVAAHAAALSLLAWEALPFGRSVGFLRHLHVLAPAVALLAAWGSEDWASGAARPRGARLAAALAWPAIVAAGFSHVLVAHAFVGPGRVELRWIVTAALGAIGIALLAGRGRRFRAGALVVAAALAAATTFATVRPIPLDSERLAIRKSVEYLEQFGLDRAVVYCNHPWFFFLGGRDRYDQRLTPRLTRAGLDAARPGELILWENHYGHRLYGDVPLEVLSGDPRFRRLLELTGGRDETFRVVLFERVAGPSPPPR